MAVSIRIPTILRTYTGDASEVTVEPTEPTLAGVIEAFPLPALGGLVIYAAIRLVDVQEFRRLWSFRRREFALAIFNLNAFLHVP